MALERKEGRNTLFHCKSCGLEAPGIKIVQVATDVTATVYVNK